MAWARPSHQYRNSSISNHTARDLSNRHHRHIRQCPTLKPRRIHHHDRRTHLTSNPNVETQLRTSRSNSSSRPIPPRHLQIHKAGSSNKTTAPTSSSNNTDHSLSHHTLPSNGSRNSKYDLPRLPPRSGGGPIQRLTASASITYPPLNRLPTPTHNPTVHLHNPRKLSTHT